MSFSTQTSNGVVAYSVTSGARTALPDWLAKRQKKSLKHDEEWRRRVELIQDLEFPEASLNLKLSRDGNYIMASGVYKPQFRVFDLSELAMKFDRHTDCENIQFEILSDDWTKSVHLQADRSIEFHTQFGCHYKTRIPKFGRDMSYHYPSCDLLTVGDSNEVWRLNLDQGRFLNSLITQSPANNVCKINPAHQLWAFGGSNGHVEFWHPTTRHKLASLDIASALLRSTNFSTQESDEFPEITAISFAADGLHCAFGTQTGHVLVYDMRSTTPLFIKDHQYGYPIKHIQYHSGTGKLVTADTRVVKIWDVEETGKLWTAIEPPYDINDVCIDGKSGLVMMANEGVQIQTYYIPQLGPAPRWCPFLDNLTEELEEVSVQTVYDDYKFVTRSELYSLGLDHLLGTNALRAYMHGYFVDLRLYEKAKAITNPFEYEEHRRRQILSKIDSERSSRISATKKLPKVNKQLAAKLLKGEYAGGDDSDEDEGKKRKNGKSRKKEKRDGADEKNPLGDERFASLFMDPEFQVDEETEEYHLHHPSESAQKRNFNRIVDDDDDEESESEIDEEMSQSSEPEGHGSDDESSSDDDTPRHSSKPNPNSRNKTSTGNRGPKFFELKDGREIGFGSARSNRTMNDKNDVKDKYSLAARMKRESGSSGGGGSGDRVVKASGNRSITFKARGEDGGFDKPFSGGSRGDRGRGRGRGRGGQARGRGRGRGRGSR